MRFQSIWEFITCIILLHRKGIRIKKTVCIYMDSIKHYKNQFEDYSISVGHNIVKNDTNMVQKIFIHYYVI